MQRMLVIVAVVLLVMVSSGIGLLAAHWPFWQRAWQWHVSGSGWPARIEGAVRPLHGGGGSIALEVHPSAEVEAMARAASTQALLVARGDGTVAGWFAAGLDAHARVDGRGLTAVVLVPLYAQFAQEHPGMLDMPSGAWLADWSDDRRGAITPRQLFWQLSGLPAGHFTPLNPFGARAQLASGPDFGRVALRWQPVWPPGSHFEVSPVNAQLLALVAARLDGAPFLDVLQKRLWSRIAADDALAMLDHRGGAMAVHCCLRASLGDWLRLGLLLANDGHSGGAALWQPGFLAQLTAVSPVHAGYGLGFRLQGAGRPLLAAGSAGRLLLIAPHSGAALLWVGEGAAPAGIERLLP